MDPTAIEGHLKLILLQWMVIIALCWAVGPLLRLWLPEVLRARIPDSSS